MCIDEHYTDTAGYTDQVFGLSHLLGFRFAPRIRDIPELKLYSFTKPSDYPKIENIIQGKINTKIIQENYDDVLRLAHSIQEGKVSGSLIMSKLGSYARQNALGIYFLNVGLVGNVGDTPKSPPKFRDLEDPSRDRRDPIRNLEDPGRDQPHPSEIFQIPAELWKIPVELFQIPEVICQIPEEITPSPLESSRSR